jgi:hypothetical protein
VFACLNYEQGGLCSKYLVPLAAIGHAYINMEMQGAVDLLLTSIRLSKPVVMATSDSPMDTFAVGDGRVRYQTAEAGVTPDAPSQVLILSEFFLSNA